MVLLDDLDAGVEDSSSLHDGILVSGEQRLGGFRPAEDIVVHSWAGIKVALSKVAFSEK